MGSTSYDANVGTTEGNGSQFPRCASHPDQRFRSLRGLLLDIRLHIYRVARFVLQYSGQSIYNE